MGEYTIELMQAASGSPVLELCMLRLFEPATTAGTKSRNAPSRSGVVATTTTIVAIVASETYVLNPKTPNSEPKTLNT
jgi:hypothetical protein